MTAAVWQFLVVALLAGWPGRVAGQCAEVCPVGEGCGDGLQENPTSCVPCPSGWFSAEASADAACTFCLLECPEGSYQTSDCAPEHDRTCATCSTCNALQRVATECDRLGGTDTVCEDCDPCPAGQVPTTPCDTNNEAVCEDCGSETYRANDGDLTCTACAAACGGGQFETTACTPTSNRACQDLTTCSLPAKYEATAPTSSSDRVCGDCTTTPCPSGEFESAACSAQADRACSQCSTCPSGQARTGVCSGSTDFGCADCTSSCPAGEYLVGVCDGISSPVCTPCTSTCAAGEYLSGTCTSSTNPECLPCTATCGENQFLNGTCSTASNTQCLSCSVCQAGFVLETNCSATTDTVCTKCLTDSDCDDDEVLVGECSLTLRPSCVFVPAASKADFSSDSMVAVAAMILGVSLAGLLAVFLFCRHLNASTKTDFEGLDDSDDEEALVDKPAPPRSPGAVLKRRSKSYIDQLNRSKVMNLEQLRRYLHQDDLSDDFMSMPLNNPLPADVPRGVEDKNRYINILPNPETRYKLLQVGSDPTSTYINGNWVTGYEDDKAWIATQGPTPETCRDFWRMVWESNASVVAMVTNVMEHGRQKCAKYWPSRNEPPMTYGSFIVRHVAEVTKPEYIETTLELHHTEEKVSTEIVHMHFLDWPDHGVPADTESAIAFCLAVREHRERSPIEAPVVIHCSAGIGRTGVMMALSNAMHEIEEEGVVDLLHYLGVLRKCRGGCVQTEGQWAFVAAAARDYFVQVEEFMRLYEQAHLFERQDAVDAYLSPTPKAAWDAQDILESEQRAAEMVQQRQRAEDEAIKQAEEAKRAEEAAQQAAAEAERQRLAKEAADRKAAEAQKKRELLAKDAAERRRREEAAEQAKLEKEIALLAEKKAQQMLQLRTVVATSLAEMMVPRVRREALEQGMPALLERHERARVAREQREAEERAAQQRTEQLRREEEHRAEQRRKEQEWQREQEAQLAREREEQARLEREEQRRVAREQAILQQQLALEQQKQLARQQAEEERLAIERQALAWAQSAATEDAVRLASLYADEIVRQDDIKARRASRQSTAQIQQQQQQQQVRQPRPSQPQVAQQGQQQPQARQARSSQAQVSSQRPPQPQARSSQPQVPQQPLQEQPQQRTTLVNHSYVPLSEPEPAEMSDKPLPRESAPAQATQKAGAPPSNRSPKKHASKKGQQQKSLAQQQRERAMLLQQQRQLDLARQQQQYAHQRHLAQQQQQQQRSPPRAWSPASQGSDAQSDFDFSQYLT